MSSGCGAGRAWKEGFRRAQAPARTCGSHMRAWTHAQARAAPCNPMHATHCLMP